MKKISLFKLFIFIVLIGNIFIVPSVNAESNYKIKISATISDTSSHIVNTFNYKITSDKDNPELPAYLPESASINIDADAKDGVVTGSTIIDFSKVIYTKPGNYVYHLTEVSSSNEKAYPHTNSAYDIYVSVSNKDGELVVDVPTEGMNLDTEEKEEVVFNHESDFTYISITTKVSGDYAEAYDKNTYFKYRVRLYGVLEDENVQFRRVNFNMDKVYPKYKIVGQDKTVTFNGKKINTTNYFVAKPNSYTDIYLKNGQTVTIGLDGDKKELPVGIYYTIESIDAPGWITKINGVRRNVLSSKELESADIKNSIHFEHIKNYQIAITGLFLDYLPIILLVVITIVGIIVIKRMKVK